METVGKAEEALVETNPPRIAVADSSNDGAWGEAVNGLAPELQSKARSD